MAGNKRIRDNADNPDLRVEIGARIGKLRTTSGISQEELANLVGVSRQTVTLWENASRDIKTTDIVRLADALGVSCDYILRGTSAANLSISEDLGLSDKAIEIIKALKKQHDPDNRKKREGLYFPPNALDILNSLIEKAECSNFFGMLQTFASSAQGYVTTPTFKFEYDGGSVEAPFSVFISKYIETHDGDLYDMLCLHGGIILSGRESWEYAKQGILDRISEYIEAVVVMDYSNIADEEKQKYYKKLYRVKSILDNYGEATSEDLYADNNEEK